METRQTDPVDMMTALGRSWGWILFFGIVTLLAGILTVAWPGRTVLVIAVLFGLQLFVGGIFRLVAAFTNEAAGHRVAYTLIGILSIIVGILCLRNLFQTVALLALILGVFWVISGVMDFFTGVFVRDMPRRGWVIFTGILGFLAGLVVLFQPAISLATLAWVLGIWLIVYGSMEIVASFSVRKLATAMQTSNDPVVTPSA
jgi:uncharacterized membrane protein HdeD (DUF308 family)